MIIYKITNLINGKIYVGQDAFDKRSYYGSGICIKRAIQKYGIENFKKEILEHCKTKKQLNKKEIYWIKKLNSKAPNGYNIVNGGTGGDILSQLSKKQQKETKQKISKAHKNSEVAAKHRLELSEAKRGTRLTKGTKQKMSKAAKGNQRRKGILHTETTKQKISESLIGRIVSEITKQKMSKAHTNKKRKPFTERHKQNMSKARRMDVHIFFEIVGLIQRMTLSKILKI